MFRKDVEKITTLIKLKMMLVEGNIMDVGLFVFSIKDVCCKSVNNWVAKKVVFKVKFEW